MLLSFLFLLLQVISPSFGGCGCGCCGSSDSSGRTVIAFMPSAPAVYSAPPVAYAAPPVVYDAPPVAYAAPPPVAYYSPSAYSPCNLGCLFRKRRVAENGDLSEQERDATMVAVTPVHTPEMAKSRPPFSTPNGGVSQGITIGNGTYYFDKLRNKTGLSSQSTAKLFNDTSGVQTFKPIPTDLGYVNVTLEGHVMLKRQTEAQQSAINTSSTNPPPSEHSGSNCALCEAAAGCAIGNATHDCCYCGDCLGGRPSQHPPLHKHLVL